MVCAVFQATKYTYLHYPPPPSPLPNVLHHSFAISIKMSLKFRLQKFPFKNQTEVEQK